MASFPFGFWRLDPNFGPSGLGFNYGYEFDGVDERINISGTLGLTTDNAFSVSYWFKRPIATSFNQAQLGEYSSTSNSIIKLAGNSAYPEILIIADDNTRVDARGTIRYDGFNEWVHVLWTKNTGTDRSDLTLYVNGILQTITGVFQNNLNAGQNITCDNLFIGGHNDGFGSPNFFTGRIDDIQFYNFELNASQVSDIYNNGYVTAPTLGPVHHWKLGEDDTFSTNWTVNDSIGSLNGTSVNMEESDRKLGVAYSMEFDGVDEYVNFGDLNLFNQYNPFTISLWIKASSSRQGLISKTTSIYNGFVLLKNFNTIRFHFGTKEFEGIQVSSSWTITADEWTHVVATFDGNDANGVTLYKSAVSGQGINRNDSIGDVSNSDDLVFGTTDVLGSLNGNLMYVSIFDSELSASDVTSLYNSGVPVDPRDVGLSPSFFTPLGGPNDSFSTNWTIVDEINGNNGTSVNMEEADKTSETP